MKRIASRYPMAFVTAVGVLFVLCHYVWNWLLPDATEVTRSVWAKAVSFAFALALLFGLDGARFKKRHFHLAVGCHNFRTRAYGENHRTED